MPGRQEQSVLLILSIFFLVGCGSAPKPTPVAVTPMVDVVTLQGRDGRVSFSVNKLPSRIVLTQGPKDGHYLLHNVTNPTTPSEQIDFSSSATMSHDITAVGSYEISCVEGNEWKATVQSAP